MTAWVCLLALTELTVIVALASSRSHWRYMHKLRSKRFDEVLSEAEGEADKAEKLIARLRQELSEVRTAGASTRQELADLRSHEAWTNELFRRCEVVPSIAQGTLAGRRFRLVEVKGKIIAGKRPTRIARRKKVTRS